MSSKASTTIGFERRFNPALAHDDVALFIAESTGASAPRPPNMERIVEMNRGRSSACSRAERARCAAQDTDPGCARHRGFAGGHYRGALSVPVSGTRFSTKAAFVLDTRPSRRSIRRGGGRSRHAMPALGRPPGHRRVCAPRGTEALELVSIEQLDALLANGAELIDVREKEERDSGYIAGSRTSRTACSRSARPISRTTGRSSRLRDRAAGGDRGEHLAAHGFDAHPS